MTEPARPTALSRSLLTLYGLPSGAYLAVSMPLSIWLMKHATDVLLIAPAAMGTILLVGRLWDAVSDPVAGYLSDRTRSRLGRRRSWLVASSIPLWLTLVMVWSPPAMLEGVYLIAWIAIALFLWETASTAYSVPYGALGLELTSDYHERTRLFAWRHMIATIGFGGALGLVFLMRTGVDPRASAFWTAAGSGLVLAFLVAACALRLPEAESHQGRGGIGFLQSFRDALANPHARLLFIVFGVESIGTGVVATLGAYIMEDLIRRPDLLETLLACWMIPQFLLAPLWIRLSRHFGKKGLWLIGMACTCGAFLSLILIEENAWKLTFAAVFMIGVGGGIANVLGPSVQADVVDYDELISGERKEGAYTAIWNFIRKAGAALAAGLGGLALSASGYDPQLDVQPQSVQDTLRLGVALGPAALYALGILLMKRFGLDEAAHADVMARIRAREG